MTKKRAGSIEKEQKGDERDANNDEEVGEPGAPEGTHLALLFHRAVRVHAATRPSTLTS